MFASSTLALLARFELDCSLVATRLAVTIIASAAAIVIAT
jgi:hypothetical protein